VILAPRFHRLRPRWIAGGGFALSAAAFLLASRLPVEPGSFVPLVVLHVVAGLGTGSALSMTHGMIGRSANPHRLFGFVNTAMSVLAILMFAFLPGQIARFGGSAVFVAFATTMGVAAVVAAFLFPEDGGAEVQPAAGAPERSVTIPYVAYAIIGTILCITINQSMVFSFLERIGIDRAFGEGPVQGVLVGLGFVNLLPGTLAALAQKRLAPLVVGMAGPVVQALLALLLTNSPVFIGFAASALFYASAVIFTHTFLFGFLTKVDPSGRVVAATPAMMMTGSAIGPALGGVIVATMGYSGLGYMAAVLGVVALFLMALARRTHTKTASALGPAVA
jgi:predicted MFS family arabinose efflux permease